MSDRVPALAIGPAAFHTHFGLPLGSVGGILGLIGMLLVVSWENMSFYGLALLLVMG
jgi:hypothetical protein